MPNYNPVTPEIIEKLKTIVGNDFVFTDDENRNKYGQDYTSNFNFPPEVVVKPATVEEVSQILKLCNNNTIPVTPRGAGTGLSGGSLPIHGGVSIAMERFNKILEIDERNFQATVEPGVINEEFQQTLIEKGYFYPPDPASKGSCFLGGNIAHNSGGPRALKYGVTRDYVLNLEVVLPNGEVIWTGANVLKNSTGYNLTHLMLGSEGTLGIVTKIVFKIISYPKHNVLMLAPFADAAKACEAVAEVFRAGHLPSALEFMERSGVEASVNALGKTFDFKEGIEAYLLVEVDGNDLEALYPQCEAIAGFLEEYGAQDILFADTSDQKEHLWKIRRSIGEVIKKDNIFVEEDTVVPRAELPRLLKGVKEIGARYGFTSVCFGHVGDGNLHVNILKKDMSDGAWENELPKAIREIFTLCKNLGGTISGEHGIGILQKPYMDIPFSDFQLDLMRGIKKVFDPKGILNPDKIF
jgi:glycolate oxidase